MQGTAQAIAVRRSAAHRAGRVREGPGPRSSTSPAYAWSSQTSLARGSRPRGRWCPRRARQHARGRAVDPPRSPPPAKCRKRGGGVHACAGAVVKPYSFIVSWPPRCRPSLLAPAGRRPRRRCGEVWMPVQAVRGHAGRPRSPLTRPARARTNKRRAMAPDPNVAGNVGSWNLSRARGGVLGLALARRRQGVGRPRPRGGTSMG